MALTDQCDIFASVHETSFNRIVRQLQAQRPSLFNYGTTTFARHPELLCNRQMLGMVDPEVAMFGDPLVKELPLLAIPGYSGPFGLEYCLQLAGLSVDFHPGNVHVLPPELAPPLAPQHFSLKGRACAGLDCPTTDMLIKLAPDERAFSPAVGSAFGVITQPDRPNQPSKDDGPLVQQTPSQPFPFNLEGIICFCLDLYAVLHVERTGSPSQPVISLRLDNLEIVDIKPDGLESAVECFLRAMLIMGVLPKVKLALNALTFKIEQVLTIAPTPISPVVPFNPAIDDDRIKTFISLTV
jgi:hypothetical protein